MRLLELFSGTKSVSKAVGHQFTEVINVDIEESLQPTIVTDILTWDYRQYPPGHFHTIWASPPCTEFSMLNYSRPEKVPNLELADRIVQKTLEIIAYFAPERWFMENPQTGSLKTREYMRDIYYRDFDYCRFSDWGYRKRTRIWTNVRGDSGLCLGRDACPNMEGGRHKKALGNGSYQEHWVRGEQKRLHQRYAIPADLITSLFL
jgi:hypothetical protein